MRHYPADRARQVRFAIDRQRYRAYVDYEVNDFVAVFQPQIVQVRIAAQC